MCKVESQDFLHMKAMSIMLRNYFNMIFKCENQWHLFEENIMERFLSKMRAIWLKHILPQLSTVTESSQRVIWYSGYIPGFSFERKLFLTSFLPVGVNKTFERCNWDQPPLAWPGKSCISWHFLVITD